MVHNLKDGPRLAATPSLCLGQKGYSMVVELRLGDGEWTAFMSDRLPNELDDAIKNKRAAFYMAAGNITPDQLLEVIPMTFPLTHLVDGFPGVARHPMDAWERTGPPLMTAKSWANICMRVAMSDLTNLQDIMEVSQKIASAL